MRVAELWRYPVKSLLGERLAEVAVDAEGVEGDRRFAIFDVATGFGLTARREPELLFASARLHSDGTPEITLPGGAIATDDAALSAWLGRPVELRRATTGVAPRYENVDEFERESSSTWSPFEGASGAFHDSAAARVSLLSRGTVGAWDMRRFRPNVVLDGEGEDGLVGFRVTVGDAVLDIGKRISRCVMTTRAQGEGIERDLDVLRAIARERDARLAVGALVPVPGTIRVGDAVVAV